MSKKKINNLFDNIFWYTLYLLPIILYILYVKTVGFDSVGFFDFLDRGLDLVNTLEHTLVYNVLTEIFDGSFITLFDHHNFIYYIVSYYVNLFILHLGVDVLLFIPRLAHKWIKGEFSNAKED